MLKSDYDVAAAFAAIEEELIASMMRNMERHGKQESAEGFQWSMWQAEQLKELNKYKKANQKKFQRPFQEINGSIRKVIEQARKQGNMEQELEILEAIKKGWKAPKKTDESVRSSAEFFKWNTRKLEALIKATEHDFQKAETAMLRMANDQYRKIIFNAQVHANTGAGTYEKAVDMAARDFLAAGINSVEYKNGARHTMRDYADMAIQTASKRAYLTGAGEKRQEWGISTVIMNKRGNPCPKCLPFVGKVMIDDVWSGGKVSDGPYPLMSGAISAGLYHPRCKDSHSTYFPGVSGVPKITKAEVAAVDKAAKREAKTLYAERQREKQERLAEHSLDLENKRTHQARANANRKTISGQTAPIDRLNEELRNAQMEAYERRRKRFGLDLTPADEIPEIFENDLRGIDPEIAKEFTDVFRELSREYDTACKSVIVTKEDFVFTPTTYACVEHETVTTLKNMRLNANLKSKSRLIERVKNNVELRNFVYVDEPDYVKYVMTHEFAHTLLDFQTKTKNHVGMDAKTVKATRKKVENIYERWQEDLLKVEKEYGAAAEAYFADMTAANEKRFLAAEEKRAKTVLSEYAKENADEFFAECFVSEKLGVDKNIYADEVMAVIDENFKARREFDEPRLLRPRNHDKMDERAVENYEAELSRIPETHKAIMDKGIDDIEIIADGPSRFDREKRKLYVRRDFEAGELIHEMAHVLETELSVYDDKRFINILRHGLGDVDSDVFYDPKSFVEPVIRMDNKKFVTKYQGRIYMELGLRTKGGEFNHFVLGEYFSEGYKTYFLEPEKLKSKDPRLYRYIEELTNNAD